MIIIPLDVSMITINKIDSEADTLGSIDGLVIESMSQRITKMQHLKDSIMVDLINPTVISDPGALTRVQAALADYTLMISLYEKMASSAIKTIDTLVKS